MTERTLPDELRSVLLAHSFEAAGPEQTVRRVLARTVEAGLADDAVAGRRPHPVALRRRNRPTSKRRARPVALIGLAGVTAAVILVAGIAIADRHRPASENTAAGSGRASAGPTARSGAGAIGSGGSGAPGGPAGTGSVGVQPKSLGPLIVAPPHGGANDDNTPRASALQCPVGWPVRAGLAATVQLPSVAGTVTAQEFRCVGPNGQRRPSEVLVLDQRAGTSAVIATLLQPAAGEYVAGLTGSTGQITLELFRPGQAGAAGELTRQTWRASTVGSGFVVSGSMMLATACGPGELAARLVDGRTHTARILQLTNQSDRPCVLSGFPTIRAGAGDSIGAPASPTLLGLGGGVHADVPPVVLLAPGAAASAVIESRTAEAGCPLGDHVTVGLPDGAPLGSVTGSVPMCELTVHPFVGGSTGQG